MSLASLLYPAPTDHGWTQWSFDNFQHHEGIQIGLKEKYGVVLDAYRLYPVKEDDLEDFLAQHQLAHNAINSVLGIAGQNIQSLDLKNKTTRDDWFFVHFIQHQSAAQILGLPIL